MELILALAVTHEALICPGSGIAVSPSSWASQVHFGESPFHCISVLWAWAEDRPAGMVSPAPSPVLPCGGLLLHELPCLSSSSAQPRSCFIPLPVLVASWTQKPSKKASAAAHRHWKLYSLPWSYWLDFTSLHLSNIASFSFPPLQIYNDFSAAWWVIDICKLG